MFKKSICSSRHTDTWPGQLIDLKIKYPKDSQANLYINDRKDKPGLLSSDFFMLTCSTRGQISAIFSENM